MRIFIVAFLVTLGVVSLTMFALNHIDENLPVIAEDSHFIVHNSSVLMLSVNTAVVDSTDLHMLSDMAVILEQAILTDMADPYEYISAAWCYGADTGGR